MIKFLVYINYLRFWPHFLFFKLSKNKRKINDDVLAYQKQYEIKGSPSYLFMYFIFMNKGFRNLFYYRIGDLKYIISWLGRGMDNFHLSKHTDVAGGILLFHPFGTLMDCESIGKGCRITHNVSATVKDGKRAVVGENVELNPCCILIGGVHIGNNCVIGPGATIFKDVPDNCVVVGNPAMILKKDGVIVKQPM